MRFFNLFFAAAFVAFVLSTSVASAATYDITTVLVDQTYHDTVPVCDPLFGGWTNCTSSYGYSTHTKETTTTSGSYLDWLDFSNPNNPWFSGSRTVTDIFYTLASEFNNISSGDGLGFVTSTGTETELRLSDYFGWFFSPVDQLISLYWGNRKFSQTTKFESSGMDDCTGVLNGHCESHGTNKQSVSGFFFDDYHWANYKNGKLVDSGNNPYSFEWGPTETVFRWDWYKDGTGSYGYLGGPNLYEVTSPTPEPATVFMMGAGLLGIGNFARRRSNKRIS